MEHVFSIYRECHYPNWRTHISQRGRLNHQPDIIWSNLTRYNPHFQMFLTEFWQKMNMSCCQLRHQLRWNPPFLVDLPQFCSGPMAIFTCSISSAVIIFPGKPGVFMSFSTSLLVDPQKEFQFSLAKNSQFRSQEVLVVPGYGMAMARAQKPGLVLPIQEIEKRNHLIYPQVI